MDDIELPRLDGVEVLIVDDEQDGSALVARILQERGVRTTCASSAQEALGYLQQRSFDVLLSDIGMPEMDGYEFLKRARQLRRADEGHMPAVAITAYARPEDRQRSLLAGYQMHLSKPIEAGELVAGMASLLRLKG